MDLDLSLEWIHEDGNRDEQSQGVLEEALGKLVTELMGKRIGLLNFWVIGTTIFCSLFLWIVGLLFGGIGMNFASIDGHIALLIGGAILGAVVGLILVRIPKDISNYLIGLWAVSLPMIGLYFFSEHLSFQPYDSLIEYLIILGGFLVLGLIGTILGVLLLNAPGIVLFIVGIGVCFGGFLMLSLNQTGGILVILFGIVTLYLPQHVKIIKFAERLRRSSNSQ